MKNIFILTLLSTLSILCFSQEESEGIKSLKRKCKEVRKQLETKYGEDLIVQDCDVSVLYGFALESVYSFKSTPNCKSKVTAYFTKGYTEIIKIDENLIYDKYAFIRKEKALNLIKPLFSGFDKFDLDYSSFEISINLKGELNESNYNNLISALEVFSKEENKDLLENKVDSITSLIPKFYLYILSNNLDTSYFPLKESEENGMLESKVKLEKKWNVEAQINTEYSIYTSTKNISANNASKYLQRKLNAYSHENDDYTISVGGFNYIND